MTKAYYIKLPQARLNFMHGAFFQTVLYHAKRVNVVIIDILEKTFDTVRM